MIVIGEEIEMPRGGYVPFLFSDELQWEREWERNRLDFLMDRIDVDAYETAVERLLRREP